MSISTAALNGDYTYLNYKNNMEGTHVAEELPAVNIALFGLGRIGTVHLDKLRRNPRVRLLYCIEESTERVNFLKNKWKLVETTFLKSSDQSKVFQDKRVDATVICTPTSSHEELILKSLESGKAVFCEKPLALTDEGIERCLKAAKIHARPLLCAFNRRFDPGARNVKLRVDAGDIGKVHVIKTCGRDSPKPSIDFIKSSGGFFHDCAVHDLDYICWVLGEYPSSVSAVAHAHFEDIKEVGDYDTAVIMMKFPSGALATIDLSRMTVYGYDQRVEVFGSKGMLTCGDQRPTGVKYHDENGTTAVPILFSFASKYQESYIMEMEHFLNVVQGIEECEIKLDGILAISKITSACEKVVNTGKSMFLDLN